MNREKTTITFINSKHILYVFIYYTPLQLKILEEKCLYDFPLDHSDKTEIE